MPAVKLLSYISRSDMIEGLSYITFIVKDIERSTHFLRIVFDADEVYSCGDRALVSNVLNLEFYTNCTLRRHCKAQ